MNLLTNKGFIEREWKRGECFPDEDDAFAAHITAGEFNTQNDVFGVLEQFEEKIATQIEHNFDSGDIWVIESMTLRKYKEVQDSKGIRYSPVPIPVSNSKCERTKRILDE